VKTGKDDNALMQQLHDYLTDNNAILQEYFSQADKDKSGEQTLAAARCISTMGSETDLSDDGKSSQKTCSV
jgi:hypothetical protein